MEKVIAYGKKNQKLLNYDIILAYKIIDITQTTIHLVKKSLIIYFLNSNKHI